MNDADAELAALRRPFLLGAVACFAAVLCLGGLLAAFGQTDDRPAGVAERWFTAAGDLTRDGVAADAAARLAELTAPGVAIDPLALFPDAAAAATEQGRALFETIQVGPAAAHGEDPDQEVLAAVVTPRDEEPVALRVQLQPADESWQVVAVTSPFTVAELDAGACGAACPWYPLGRPARAPLGYWLGTLLFGALIVAGCTAAVRAATPKP